MGGAERVAVTDRHDVRLHAEVIGDDLGERRLVALAVWARTRDRGDGAGALHAHHTALPAERGRLDVEREPDADQLAAAAPLGVRAAQRGVVGGVERALKHGPIVAGVVDLAGRRREGKRLARDRVAPPHLGRIETAGVRRLVDQPLDEERGLRPAGAAVGAHRRGRRDRAGHLDVDGADRVGARQAAGVVARVGRGRERQVGAERRLDPRAQAADRPVGVERQRARRAGAARVLGREEIFLTRRDPLHRPSHAAREPGDQRLLAVWAPLDAEAAPDVGRDHPHAPLVETQHPGDLRPDAKRRLRRRPHRQGPGRLVPGRERATRLHRHAGDQVLLDGQLDHRGRLCERSVGIARPPGLTERAVARRLLEDSGCAGRQRHRGGGDTRQGPVLDGDEGCRIPRGGGRLGDDGRDRRALGVHALAGEERVRRHDHVAKEPVDRQGGDHAQIGGRDDVDHAGGLPGALDVQADHARVGVGAADQRQVRQARHGDIVDEAPAPADEGRVLTSPERAADPGHRSGAEGLHQTR